MTACYHNKCDDLSIVTETNLRFLKKTADTLIKTVNRLAGGVCGSINRQNDKTYDAHEYTKKTVNVQAPQQEITHKTFEMVQHLRAPRISKREADVAEEKNEKSKEDMNRNLRQQTPYAAYLNAFKQGQVNRMPSAPTSLGAPIALTQPSNSHTQHQQLPHIPIINRPEPKPEHYIQTQGNYILPDSAILAAPGQRPTAMQSSVPPIPAPPLQQQVLPAQQVLPQPAARPLVFGNAQQSAANNQPQTMSLVQRKVRIPFGLLIAKNAYNAFMTNMNRYAPMLG